MKGTARMVDETTMGGDRGSFEPTSWTVVLSARDRSPEAMDELLRVYWKPVYLCVRRWGASVEDAKDLTQGYFTEFLRRDFLKDVSSEKGRFRAFLLTTLRRYLVNQKEHRLAQKRGGGERIVSLDFAKAETEYSREPASDETPESFFQRQWA